MLKQNFDITTKPLSDDDYAAYLVDDDNVEMHRQYVEKYYGKFDLKWFDINIMEPIRTNKIQKLILFYYDRYISVNHDFYLSRATHKPYTIYYITKAVMTIE